MDTARAALSRRAVFFLKSRVVRECHCDIWESSKFNPRRHLHGSRSGDPCQNRFMGTATGFQQSPWPNMDQYSRIVSNYSSRKLTHESDTVPAFMGIMNVLEHSFIGGFLYGLPGLFFDVALLWRPIVRIRRKQAKSLPSWSWMGWDFGVAAVDLTLWRAAADYLKSTEHRRRGDDQVIFRSENKTKIISTVKWYIATPKGYPRIRIDNTGLQHQNMQETWKDWNSLPQGWSRTFEGFQHDCDYQSTFNYPIPIQYRNDDRSVTPDESLVQNHLTPVLHLLPPSSVSRQHARS
jgi:hypothetical protein